MEVPPEGSRGQLQLWIYGGPAKREECGRDPRLEEPLAQTWTKVGSWELGRVRL